MVFKMPHMGIWSVVTEALWQDLLRPRLLSDCTQHAVCFCGAGGGTWGQCNAGQVLYHWTALQPKSADL